MIAPSGAEENCAVSLSLVRLVLGARTGATIAADTIDAPHQDASNEPAHDALRRLALRHKAKDLQDWCFISNN